MDVVILVYVNIYENTKTKHERITYDVIVMTLRALKDYVFKNDISYFLGIFPYPFHYFISPINESHYMLEAQQRVTLSDINILNDILKISKRKLDLTCNVILIMNLELYYYNKISKFLR